MDKLTDILQEVDRSIVSKVKSQTADQAYKMQQKELDGLMKKFHQKLKKHASEQKKNPRDWGYPGDLGHYVEVFEELLGMRG